MGISDIGLVAIIYIWSVIELININVIVKKCFRIPLKKIKKEELIIKICTYIIIVSFYTFALLSNHFYVKEILEILMYIKSAIIISALYEIKIKQIAFIAFYVELVSFLGVNIGVIFQNISKPTIVYGYLCELLAELLFLIIILTLGLLKKYHIIEFWIVQPSIVDVFLFIVILKSLNVWEWGVFEFLQVNIKQKGIFALLVVCVLIIIIRTIIISQNVNMLEDVNYLLDKQIKQSEDYYKELIKKDKEVEKFQHDLNNLLLALYDLISSGENNKALSYIEEIKLYAEKYRNKYNTGNVIADAIVRAEQLKAKEYNIEITFKGCIPSNRIDDIDLVIVLSNMLDNAIEASARINGKKRISIKSILGNGLLIIKVDNPSNEVTIKRNNVICTTKEDKKSHGFGLENIKNVCKKYNGSMTLSYKEGIFTSIVELKLKVLE